jgi:hypothetical protein
MGLQITYTKAVEDNVMSKRKTEERTLKSFPQLLPSSCRMGDSPKLKQGGSQSPKI